MLVARENLSSTLIESINGPTKVGSTRVSYPELILVSDHMAAIIIVSRHVAKVFMIAYKDWSFGVSLFWLCCGCVEGAKCANGHYCPEKHQVDCSFFGLLWHRRNSRHFTTCCGANLLRSCEKEAFGSSLGIVAGSNRG